MLKLFLLIPLIVLEVVAILGLVYYTVVTESPVGLLAIFVGVIVLLSLLATISFDEKHA
jgi:hypothetical protein